MAPIPWSLYSKISSSPEVGHIPKGNHTIYRFTKNKTLLDMICRTNTFEETEYYWLIPSAIDLPTILKEHPPTFSYKIHYFYYLIDIICDRMDFLDEKDKVKWVALKSTRMQRIIPKYYQYLQYLKDRGILDYNPSYRVGEACKGFRISSEYYGGSPIEVPITRKDWVIWKKVQELKGLKKCKKIKVKDDGYSHLSKWFNEKLVIDVQGARNEMKSIFPTIPEWRKYTNSKGKIIWTNKNTRFKSERAIRRLECGDFYHRIDTKIGRYHSNLTGLKKELRNFLTFDSKRLVALDIRNSQPLLSGLLLNPKFYEKMENFNILSITSLLSLEHINQFFIHSIPSICNTIMLGESSESLIHKEFQQYLALVQKGTFYEEMAQLLYPRKRIDRKHIKRDIYIIFFSKNKCRMKLKRNKMPFKRGFPTVYSIFNMLKKYNSKILSHILQRLESHIVIESATRRIALERPDLPIFTIHDSITTTVGDEDYVEGVLKEEIKAVTRLDANIGKEYWDKPNESIITLDEQLR